MMISVYITSNITQLILTFVSTQKLSL